MLTLHPRRNLLSLGFERDVSVSENLRSVSRTAGLVPRSSRRSPVHPLFGYSVGPWVTEPPWHMPGTNATLVLVTGWQSAGADGLPGRSLSDRDT